ncbi:MAG: extracellular solute-binding protein [Oscillospiraceae bacterium]|nr:extracellular solute-binding protein [Oscillospiraceae bacterium]
MKNMKRTLAGLSAVVLTMGFASCQSNSAETPTEAVTTVATTTGVTVEVNTETLAEESQMTLDEAADAVLPDKELENKTIKWLAHYDINPNTASGASESVPLNVFRTKYGGEIQYYPSTWNTRFSDLSTYVLGGEGIDFFPCETAALPRGVVNGMFQPVDDYIDMNDPLWQDVEAAMEVFNFNGKHYEFVSDVHAENVVIYNKQTIEENNFDDPWELYKEGKWNWDTFKDMLMQFVDEEADQYGLDGYWAEKALFLSGGVPAVSSEDGSLVVHLMDPTVEKAQNFMYDLWVNNLVINREIFDWAEQPQFMGEGKELFYIVGAWHVQADPETWATKIPPENLGLAPVPNAADAEHPWQASAMDNGFLLCKGAANPEGVALFAMCNRFAATNDDAIAISDQKAKDDFKWSDELIAINKEINDLARQYPVVDLATGVSTDVASITTDGGDNVGLRAAMHGVDWATNRDEISGVVEMLVSEVDGQLKALN